MTKGDAGPEPELVQLLTPEGERIDSVTGPDGTEYRVDFTDEEYRGLYRDLVVVRKLDAEATALQRQGELGIWASLLGQEAAQVGSGRALRPQDMAFPTYREHGVLYCRGIDPIMPLGLFRGVDQGGWDPNEFKFNMYTIVIGAQTLHATGYAMGITMDGKVGTDDGEAVIAYFGDGATSQGDVNEAFIWASVFNAPIVFFCQNNQYAISEPLERQTRVPLYQRAAGFGFPGVRVDGNDVLATYAVTRAALDNARLGQGPTLIEAYTYRMGAHTTSDDPTRYRIASEVEAWQAKDPIARVQGVPGEAADRRRRILRRGRRPGQARGRAPARAGARHARPGAADDLRPRLPERLARARRAARAVRPLPGVVRGEHPLMDRDHDARQGPQHRAAPRAGERPQGHHHGRGRRQARRRLPDHRRPAEGLRRGAGHRHPAGRVRHHRHRGRPGHPRLPAGLRDPVRRLRLPGVRPDRVPGREDALPLAGQGAPADRHPDPVRRRHRRGRAPLRVARGVLRAHRRPQGRRLLQPAGRVLDDPAGDRLRRPDRLLRAEAALLGEGRGRPGHAAGRRRTRCTRRGWCGRATT